MKYIKGYDGLRAFSIILVVLTHLGLGDILPENEYVRNRVWLLFSGLTGVQVFFTLSGFLITGILLKERMAGSTINLKNFYIRRFLRLLPPLVIFYLVVGILMFYHKIVTTSVGFTMAVTYTYNFIPVKFYSGELGHMWSLAVEEQFYLVWPVLLLFVTAARRLYAIIAAIILACVAAIYLLPGIPIHGGTTTLGEMFLVKRWFIPAVGPIMIGSGFAIFVHYNYEKLAHTIKNNKLILLFAFVLYASPLYLPGMLLDSNAIFVSFGVSLFLLWIYFNQEGILTNALQRQPWVYIGKISYGIYVYQGFFLRTGPTADSMAIQKFPVNIILTIIVAILSYELFEKRVLKLKDKFK